MNAIVVVPTFNESENIGPLLESLLAVSPDLSVLVVDDNSPDQTGAAVRSVQCRFPGRVYLHSRDGKLGLASAYVAGFRHALALGPFDAVVQMDADFSHPPAALLALLERAPVADVVIGSRYCAGASTHNWGAGRWMLSRAAAWLVRTALHLPLCDPVGGFKCFSRRALEQIDFDEIRSRGFAFQIEMNWICRRLGLQMVEVPIRFEGRQAGRSKVSWGIIWEALRLLSALRHAPLPLKRESPAAWESPAAPGVFRELDRTRLAARREPPH